MRLRGAGMIILGKQPAGKTPKVVGGSEETLQISNEDLKAGDVFRGKSPGQTGGASSPGNPARSNKDRKPQS